MGNGKVKMGVKAIVCAAMLWLCLAVPALAGPFEDGLVAYQQKDYATAVRLWCPLAGQGDAAVQFNLGFMYYAARHISVAPISFSASNCSGRLGKVRRCPNRVG